MTDYLRKRPGSEQHELLAIRVRNYVEQYRERARADRLEEESSLAARARTDAFWVWDVATDTVRYDGFGAFGYDEGDPATGLGWWVERLHPDDRERLREFAEALESGDPRAFDDRPEGLSRFSTEFRFRRADGTYAHCLARGVDRFFDSLDELTTAIDTSLDQLSLPKVSNYF